MPTAGRFNKYCAPIQTASGLDGVGILWVTCLQYLDVYLVADRGFACSLDKAEHQERNYMPLGPVPVAETVG